MYTVSCKKTYLRFQNYFEFFFSSTKKTTSPKKGIKKPKKFKPPANFGFQVTISTIKKRFKECIELYLPLVIFHLFIQHIVN